jgi:hypothetical protein
VGADYEAAGMTLSRKSGNATRRSWRDGSPGAAGASGAAEDAAATGGETGPGSGAGEDDGYQSPAVFSLGPVWQVTLGSSSNGSADANSHYYW